MEKLSSLELEKFLTAFNDADFNFIKTNGEELLKLGKRDVNLYNLLAVAYFETNEYQKIIEISADALQIKKTTTMLNNLGLAWQKLRSHDKAISAFLEALEISPKSKEPRMNLANLYFERGIDENSQRSLELAKKNYVLLTRDYQDLPGVHNNLGIIYQKLNNEEQAIKSFEEAIAINKSFVEALVNLGNLMKWQNLETAELHFCKALEIDSKSEQALFGLASVYFRNEQWLQFAETLSQLQAILENKNIENDFLWLPVKIHLNHGTKFGSMEQKINWPLQTVRPVEPNLLNYVNQASKQDLGATLDARYGNGHCTSTFDFLNSSDVELSSIGQRLLTDVEKLMDLTILHHESFVNIMSAGSGSSRHSHTSRKDNEFDLWKYKYSLVYYLNVGDQSTDEPGILKIYNPDRDILPLNGTMVIIPATVDHSSSYSGSRERIMLGINFYADKPHTP